jgi:hypothetical protein
MNNIQGIKTDQDVLLLKAFRNEAENTFGKYTCYKSTNFYCHCLCYHFVMCVTHVTNYC